MRNGHIGIGVSIAILAIGFVLFRHYGETAIQIVGMVGFFSAFVVAHALDERERRRENRSH
jgi:hypothetical protein